MIKTSKCSKFGLFSRYFISETLPGLLRGFLDRTPRFDAFPKHSGELKLIQIAAIMTSQRCVQFVSESLSDFLYFEL